MPILVFFFTIIIGIKYQRLTVKINNADELGQGWVMYV